MTVLKFDQVCDDKQSVGAPRRLSQRLTVRRRVTAVDEVSTDQQLRLRCETLERQLAEKSSELISVEENLKQSNEGFQQFANAVSHDLQTPLRAISGFSGFLQEEYQHQLDDTASGYITRVVDGGNRMKQLIEGLVLFSRVTSKAAPFEKVNLNEVVGNILAVNQNRICELNAVVTADPLPTVLGDRTQLTLVLQNLIENGLKFRSDAPPVVHVSVKQNSQELTFSVRDNGIGIDKGHHKSVFAIFRRLDVSQEYEGVGAGLAICRRVVERHSGQIWCDSKLDNGSTFFFTIPVSK